MSHLRSPLATLAVVVSCMYATSQASAETWIVSYPKWEATCVRQLEAGTPPGDSVVAQEKTSQILNLDLPQSENMGVVAMYRDGAQATDPMGPLAIITEPFMFHDAAHFAAFAASPQFDEMAADHLKRTGLLPLALAYRGNRYLFTSGFVLAEPPHFKDRGDGSVPSIFVHHMDTWWLNALGSNIFFVAPPPLREALSQMKDLGADGIIMPLASYTRPELREHVGHLQYVHTPALMSPIGIFIKGEAWSRLAPERQAAIRNWARQTALACSRENYDREAQQFRTLEQNGVTVVPMNVQGMQDAVLSTLLVQAGNRWTRRDYERLQALR